MRTTSAEREKQNRSLQALKDNANAAERKIVSLRNDYNKKQSLEATKAELEQTIKTLEADIKVGASVKTGLL